MPKVQVRYMVNDLDEAVAFYRDRLGFVVDMQRAPRFAMLSRGDLRLVLNVPSGPGDAPGGSAPMPDGTRQVPGGWNRFAIEVEDLEALVGSLRAAGARFRNDIVSGVGGRQIILEDPSGNPIELFQPLIDVARLDTGR